MIIKYSVGSITSVKDNTSTEAREEKEIRGDYMVICKKCGIQHLLMTNEKRNCCGMELKKGNN